MLTHRKQNKNKLLESYYVREQHGTLLPKSEKPVCFLKWHQLFTGQKTSSKLFTRGQDLVHLQQINKKLQEVCLLSIGYVFHAFQVLEDTMLKNIALKENIDTLTQHST